MLRSSPKTRRNLVFLFLVCCRQGFVGPARLPRFCGTLEVQAAHGTARASFVIVHAINTIVIAIVVLAYYCCYTYSFRISAYCYYYCNYCRYNSEYSYCYCSYYYDDDDYYYHSATTTTTTTTNYYYHPPEERLAHTTVRQTLSSGF